MTTTTDKPITKAALYVRISLDRDGDALGVARQETVMRALAKTRGINVTRVYVDNDRSASEFATKNRPEFEAMMSALDAGVHDAVLVYNLDRFTRRLRDIVDWLPFLMARGIPLITSDGTNTATEAGILTTQILVSVAENEVRRMSSRMRLRNWQDRQAGYYTSVRRPFGYVIDGRGKRERMYRPHPVEGPALRNVVDMLLRGETPAAALRYLQATVPPANGGDRWHATTFRNILTNPLLCGQMPTDEEGVYRRAVNVEPITDELHSIAIRQRFDDVAHNKHLRGRKRPARVHVLAGLVTCGVCFKHMQAHVSKVQGTADVWSRRSWVCVKALGGCGKTNRNYDAVWTKVRDYIAQAVAIDSPSAGDVAAAATDGDAALREEIAALETERAAVMASVTDRVLTMTEAMPTLRALREAQDVVEGQRDAALKAGAQAVQRAAVAAGDMLSTLDDTAADVNVRAAIVALYVDAVVIRPTTKRGRGVDWDAIVVVPRGTGEAQGTNDDTADVRAAG